MKRAGEVLSALFDERLMKKAQGYSRLFDYWNTALPRQGIAAAADHSRIRQMERGILQVEADHPGWIQILQTKEHLILEDFRRTFPDMDIGGISLMLSRGRPDTNETDETIETSSVNDDEAVTVLDASVSEGYDAIKDGSFKETLKRLQKSIAQKERSIEPVPKLG